jgi:hypothetical protein
MSKVFKVVGTIAGIAALVAGTIATAGIGTAAFAAVAGTVAAGAGIVSSVSMLAAQATAKKPPAQGSLTQILILSSSPTPYLIGETYFGGVMRHDVGYGGKVSKVQNPYRQMPVVYSGCGPVQGLVGMYADFQQVPFSGAAATGYYSGFMYRSVQLGATPEASALAPQWPGMPGWSGAHKLSGKAAILWGVKFDKEGEIFAGGVPQLGAIWQGVKVYDPRLDSTRPGGSGAHRITNEATWSYSQNPALHALTYAYGRYRSGKKIFGIGLPADSILIGNFTAWANVCDANSWRVGGIIFEPGDRWANLKRIMAAGSAEPIFAGGALSVKYDAPRVSLVTITGEDIVDADCSVRAMQTWRERFNTIVPKYRSAVHKWDYVESTAIVGAGYLAEDGEEKIDTYQIDLCQNKDQAAQLAAYRLVNGREISPINITLKPQFRFFRPGDMVTINEPELGLINQDCVILRRSVDPQSFTVTFTLMSETAAKHDFALGRTGTAPPTPTLTSSEDKDNTAQTNQPGGSAVNIVFKRSATQPSTPGDSSGTPATWYADIASVPASSNPLWSSFGTRSDIISDFVWQTPVRLEGQDGAPGAPGANGLTLYTWYAYADSADGVVNFTTGSPAGRIYIGQAPNKTTATESTNPADYSWSRYVGPAAFGLAASNANSIVGPDFVQKIAATSSWTDAGALSTEAFTGAAQVSFEAETDGISHYIIGLNAAPGTIDFSDIDYAVHITSAGNYYLVESGGLVVGPLAFTAPARFTINYDGLFVRYYRHDASGTTLLRQVAATAGLSFYLDASLWAANSRINGITWAPGGRSGDDGAPGDDGISPVLATASPASKQFSADADGAVKAGQLPFPVVITATKAGSSIGGDVTVLSVSGCTATATSDGFTFDTIGADEGYAEWEFEATDGQTVVGRVSFSRQRDPTGGGEVLVNFSSTSWYGSGSYASSGPTTTLSASATGKLKLTGFASFFAATNGSSTITGKLQYRAVGSGTWLDAGISGSGVATRTIGVPGEPNDNTPGVINISGNLTGLTANGSYEMQLVGSRTGNTVASATGYVAMKQVP